MYPSLYVLGFFSLLNSEAYYVFPAWSSFEVHREIIFIKLKKTILHMITLLSHVGKHRSSLYQASALRPPHKCFTCHMYFCEHMIFECMISKIHTFFTPFLSAIHNRSHNIKFTSAMVSSSQVFYVMVTHTFVNLLFSHTYECICAIWRKEHLCPIFHYSKIISYIFLYCTGFSNSNPN